MKLRLLIVVLFILGMGALTTCTSPPMPGAQDKVAISYTIGKPMPNPWMAKEDAGLIHEEIDIEPDDTDVEETELTKEQMIDEVISIWTIFLNDDGARADDDRKKMFYTYAEALVEKVLIYQNPDNDTGAWLPKHKTTHALLATMVTLESSVIPDVVGKSNGEVGLLQVHGKALAGYSSKKVQKSYDLGLLLGVRWLSTLMTECPETMERLESGEWTEQDWLKPLSVYAGGPNAKRNGKCITFGVARKRVDLTKLYLTRISTATGS